MAVKKSGGLPSEYQQVEWIGVSNSSGPYIQTNIKLTNGPVRFLIKYSCSDGGIYGRDFFGVRSGTNVGQQALMVKTNRARDNFFISSGNVTDAIYIGINETEVPYNSNSIVEIDASLSAGNSQSGTLTSTFTVNGVSGTVAKTGITGNNTIKPLSILGSSTASTRAIGKIYGEVKVWNDGGLVLHAIPCYRKADNVIGMYDTVHEVFYTNAGNGTFTKGGNV